MGKVISVIRISDKRSWYYEYLNTKYSFHVIKYTNDSRYWLSPNLFFLPQDVKEVKPDTNTLIPSFLPGLA